MSMFAKLSNSITSPFDEKKKSFCFFLFLSTFVVIDRITKFYAFHCCAHKEFTSFISWQFILNRGIVCGLFNSLQPHIFFLVTLAVIFLYLLLGTHTIIKHRASQPVWGELIVLSGGISNILDRFFYHGVIDFILIAYKNWAWPIFNVADVLIVAGIFLMIISSIYE